MSELAIAIVGGLCSVAFGLIAALWTIAVREINLLRKRVHDLANVVQTNVADIKWLERELKERTDP